MKLTIEVPDRFMAKAKDMLSRLEAELRHDEVIRLVGLDDRAMLEYLDQRCGGQKNKEFPPVVRASTYGDDVRNSQEIGLGVLGDRRPVLMRGSIEAMIGKYDQKSAMAKEIALRFLRRIKFTALTGEAFDEMNSWLGRRLSDDGWYIHNHALDWHKRPGIYSGHDEVWVWLGGEHTTMPAEKYEQALRAAKRREADRVQREIKERKAKKQYQDLVTSLRSHSEERRQQRGAARRKRRATEIAAYELLSEIGAIK